MGLQPYKQTTLDATKSLREANGGGLVHEGRTSFETHNSGVRLDVSAISTAHAFSHDTNLTKVSDDDDRKSSI